MALSLNFTFGAPCSGGNHVPVTAALTGAITRSRAITVTREELLAVPTTEEADTAIAVIIRLLIAPLATKTNANIKTAIEAKTINLTVTG